MHLFTTGLAGEEATDGEREKKLREQRKRKRDNMRWEAGMATGYEGKAKGADILMVQ